MFLIEFPIRAIRIPQNFSEKNSNQTYSVANSYYFCGVKNRKMLNTASYFAYYFFYYFSN